MARIGVGDKYHISLNGVGYLFRGLTYRKKDARVFGNRFATGEMGQADLDLWKLFEQSDFSGGALQPNFIDTAKFNSSKNLMINSSDNRFYLAPKYYNTTHSMLDAAIQFIIYKGGLYVITAYGIYSYNVGTKAWTAVKTDFATTPSSMAVVNNKLWVATYGGYFWSYDGTTWAADTGFGVTKLCAFNSQVYCSGKVSTNDQGKLFKHTGGTGSAETSVIGVVGDINVAIDKMCVFNSRLYIGKDDGLYAYDGVQISTILDLSNSIGNVNCTSMVVFNGALYFNIGNILFRFNGSTIERMAEFPGNIHDLHSAFGKLFILLETPGTIIQSAEVYQYDGVGFFCIYSVEGLGAWCLGSYSNFSAIGSTNYQSLFVASGGAEVFQIRYINLADSFTATNANTSAILEPSVFDGRFPSVDKYMNSVELDTLNMVNGDSILVEFKTFNNGVWTAYQTLGTVTHTGSREVFIYNTAYSGVFRKIQLRFTITRAAASTMSLGAFNMKYVLSPEYKREWSMRLLCQGDSENALELIDGTLETKTALSLRDNIYLARESVSPVAFEDMDYTFLNGAHTNAITTFSVDTTNGYATSGFIKVDDEVIAYTGKTANTFTGCTRAMLGTAAAAHNDNSYVTPYFRVILSDIPLETVIEPSDNSYGTPTEIEVILKEV